MRLPFLFPLLFLVALGTARGGTITGTVRAEGKPGADAAAAGGKYDSRQFKFVERVDYTAFRDFIVYVDGLVLTNAQPPTQPEKVVTSRVSQQGAMLNTHVLPVLVGTTVEWPNNDDILHNVFSYSEAKSFDLGLYKNPVVKQITFDKPGRVDVFCSIHCRMSCIILVLPNPYFAATNDKGAYTIKNVPAGTYHLKAWHERLPSDVQDVTVPETGSVHLDFTLGIKNLPKG